MSRRGVMGAPVIGKGRVTVPRATARVFQEGEGTARSDRSGGGGRRVVLDRVRHLDEYRVEAVRATVVEVRPPIGERQVVGGDPGGVALYTKRLAILVD